MKIFRKNNKGFTLVELLVVIAIIAILAAVIAPNAFKAIDKAKVSAVVSDYRAVKVATLVYYSDTGKWPTSSTASKPDPGFVANPFEAADPEFGAWNGPYLDVWNEKSPFGAYAFESEDSDSVWIDNKANGVYLTIKNLSDNAWEKLKEDLGENVIVFGSQSEAKLKIATK